MLPEGWPVLSAWQLLAGGIPDNKPGMPDNKPGIPDNKPGMPDSKPGIPVNKPEACRTRKFVSGKARFYGKKKGPCLIDSGLFSR